MVTSIALAVNAAMLLPAATAPTAFAQDESVAPSASVEASGSPLPDAEVELMVDTEGDPALEWAIAVTGGSPSVNVLTLEEFEAGFVGAFTVAVFGQSATVEMTAALPSGWGLIQGACLELHKQPPGELHALAPPRRLVLEVVQGGQYGCFAISDPLGGAPDPTVPPTVPRTDTLAGAPPGPPSGAWSRFLIVMAAVFAATLLIALRTRRVAFRDRS